MAGSLHDEKGAPAPSIKRKHIRGGRHGQATQEEYKETVQVGRYRGRKTKAQLDLNGVRDMKGSNTSFSSSKKMISEKVGLLLNRAGNLVTKDTEKAEVSHMLFVSVFTSKADVKK